MKRKIFIGFEDIASQIRSFAEGFQACGLETMTAVFSSESPRQMTRVDYNIKKDIPQVEWFKDPQLGEKLNKTVEENLHRFIWKKACAECDIFMFIWHSFVPDFSDYAELKKMGKKIIIFFVGSDIRWYDGMVQQNKKYHFPIVPYSDAHKHISHLHKMLNRLRHGEKYADLIHGTPEQNVMSLRPYHDLRVPIELNLFQENNEQRERPLVIHAPSWRQRKGSEFVLSAFERLKAEGVAFDTQFIENMEHSEAIKCYENADILVGQLLMPFGGKQERELLACGKVVLSSVGYHFIKGEQYTPQTAYEECPIIDITPETVYTKLKETILDYKGRKERAKRGRPWVEKYHDAKKVCERILMLLDTNDTRFDYYPHFLRDEYLPRNQEHAHLINQYTQFVSECEWYKTYVNAGERSGLVFPGKSDETDLLSVAIQLFQKGQLNESAEYVKQVLEKDPEEIKGYFLLASISEHLGDFDSAIQLTTHALSIQPDQIDLWRKQGELLLKSGNIEKGLNELQSLINKYPNDVESLKIIHSFLIQLGQTQDATIFQQRIEQIQQNT